MSILEVKRDLNFCWLGPSCDNSNEINTTCTILHRLKWWHDRTQKLSQLKLDRNWNLPALFHVWWRSWLRKTYSIHSGAMTFSFSEKTHVICCSQNNQDLQCLHSKTLLSEISFLHIITYSCNIMLYQCHFKRRLWVIMKNWRRHDFRFSDLHAQAVKLPLMEMLILWSAWSTSNALRSPSISTNSAIWTREYLPAYQRGDCFITVKIAWGPINMVEMHIVVVLQR